MTKGLEALNRTFGSYSYYKSYEIIEKELKALEIIREKYIDIDWLIKSEDWPTYDLGVNEKQSLTNKEYNLLKEVLL